MSEPLTLLRLLGVETLAEAALKWPRATLLPGLGFDRQHRGTRRYEPLINYLNTVLRFAGCVRVRRVTASGWSQS